MSIDVKLKRADRIYKSGDEITGVIVVTTRGGTTHQVSQHTPAQPTQGLTLSMEGQVTMQLSAKSVGLFEAFYHALGPITLVKYSIQVANIPPKFPDGVTEIPFSMPLKPVEGQELFETYHGVFVNIQYMLKADLTRSWMSGKSLTKSVEFVVEQKDQGRRVKEQPVPFCITPESLENVKQSALASIPRFKVSGRLKSAVCPVNRPLVGELIVEESEAVIKSIELQLVRVETCGSADGYAKEATEIQNLQIADGDVARGMVIPIYMVFPRLFTCPTLGTRTFKIEFEVNLVVLLSDGKLLTENFPMKLVRP